MSLLIPAIAASTAWYVGATALDLKRRAQTHAENAHENRVPDQEDAPFHAPIGHISQRFFSDTRGRFTSVREDIDHIGAKIFLVDYGNGQEVIQYVDPRILL